MDKLSTLYVPLNIEDADGLPISEAALTDLVLEQVPGHNIYQQVLFLPPINPDSHIYTGLASVTYREV